MKPDLLHILQHSLGADRYGRGTQYRNRFVTGPGSDDFAKCNELTQLGFMFDHGPQPMTGGMHCFTVTETGKSEMREHSPQPPKLSRSQQRYQQFLEGGGFMKFGEWLRRAKV